MMADDRDARIAQLEAENAALRAHAAGALERQRAFAEVLRVIASSPTHLDRVLGAVAESAARLCGADQAFIGQFRDGLMRAVASFGPISHETATRTGTGGSPLDH